MGIIRFGDNPIIKREDVLFNVNSIFNPGAVKINDDYLLLCRIEMPTGRSSFLIARSKDGYNFILDNEPNYTPVEHKKYYEYVEWGIEDPRITKIDDKYLLTYTGYSKYKPVVMLSETKDFKSFVCHGVISEASNKDCAIFPEKIGDK